MSEHVVQPPIKSLVHLESAGVVRSPDLTYPGGERPHHIYTVQCRDCGNVTRRESGFTVNDAPTEQAHLYAQRHLARHLTALAEEFTKFTR